MPRIRPIRFLSHRPWLISVIIIVALASWLALGTLQADESPMPPLTSQTTAPLVARVVYQHFNAQPVAKTLELYGRTAPDRQANLGAEVSGRVERLLVAKGAKVEQGQAIVQLDSAGLETALERARATLALRAKEYKAAQSLKRKGLQGEVSFTQAESALITAKAQERDARTALDNARIKAPFSGIVEQLPVEVGDFVGVGDPVATLIDLSQVVIKVDVGERHVQSLQLEQAARIRLVDGRSISGTIRYIARNSSPATNTYPVEIVVDNQAGHIPSGMSAEVDLALSVTKAIKVTPAMLALDDEGNLGVKVLEPDQQPAQGSHADLFKVRFVPIQLVKAEQDGVWLSGFGDSADIIVVGQGFVRDGDRADAVKRDRAGQQE